MKIYSKSNFKEETKDLIYFENWVTQLEKFNNRHYERYEIRNVTW
jgi:hypothetical protein